MRRRRPQKTPSVNNLLQQKEKFGVVLRSENHQYIQANDNFKYDVALSTNNFEKGITLTQDGLVLIENEGFYQIHFTCVVGTLPEVEQTSKAPIITLFMSPKSETNESFISFPCPRSGNFTLNTMIKCNKSTTLSVVTDTLLFVNNGITFTIFSI